MDLQQLENSLFLNERCAFQADTIAMSPMLVPRTARSQTSVYYGDLLGDRLYDEAGRKAALSDLTNSEEASEQIKATSVSC